MAKNSFPGHTSTRACAGVRSQIFNLNRLESKSRPKKEFTISTSAWSIQFLAGIWCGIIGFKTGCGTQGVLHMKDPPGVAVGCTRRCSCSGCDQALGPPHLVVAPIKPYMLSVPSFSQVLQFFRTSSCPRRQLHQLLQCAISRFFVLLIFVKGEVNNEEMETCV